MYQVGQAVISPSGSILVKDEIYSWVELISGSMIRIIGSEPKIAATEAEILAEIEKHGWKVDHGYSSPLGFISISKVANTWRPSGWNTNISERLLEFGNECIQAHRIITALNLANEKPL